MTSTAPTGVRWSRWLAISSSSTLTRLPPRHYPIAAPESCTGGLFRSRLTDVPGSSTYVRAGVIAYAYEDKTSLLGVPRAMIETNGAVSEQVAVAMAEGIRERTGADVAVGITGIA